MMDDWAASLSTGFCWFPKLTGAAGPGELGAGKLNRTRSVLPQLLFRQAFVSHDKRAASVTSSNNYGAAHKKNNDWPLKREWGFTRGQHGWAELRV